MVKIPLQIKCLLLDFIVLNFLLVLLINISKLKKISAQYFQLNDITDIYSAQEYGASPCNQPFWYYIYDWSLRNLFRRRWKRRKCPFCDSISCRNSIKNYYRPGHLTSCHSIHDLFVHILYLSYLLRFNSIKGHTIYEYHVHGDLPVHIVTRANKFDARWARSNLNYTR